MADIIDWFILFVLLSYVYNEYKRPIAKLWNEIKDELIRREMRSLEKEEKEKKL